MKSFLRSFFLTPPIVNSVRSTGQPLWLSLSRKSLVRIADRIDMTSTFFIVDIT